MGLYFSLATRATEGGVEEESLTIFSDGGVACGYTGELSI